MEIDQFYLLLGQGSNVDGLVMNTICLKFGIERHRSSTYHSQGNGFAERNIRSVREILRSVFLDKNISQKYWCQLLPGGVFALNMSESKAIKCIPYNVVFGRPAALPQDVLLGISKKFQLRNATTAAQFADDIYKILHKKYLTMCFNSLLLQDSKCSSIIIRMSLSLTTKQWRKCGQK